jgi:hypothetical protein
LRSSRHDIVRALYGSPVTPIQHDAIGICPAILLPDPMQADDEAFERVVHAAAGAGFTSF